MFSGEHATHHHSPGTWLDEADRKRLAAVLAAAREARVYRRLEALLLVAEGHSMAEAARRCRVNRSSGDRRPAEYKAEHEASALLRPLVQRAASPSISRLTPQRLAAALARDPRRCGYQATSWTVPLLAHDLSAKGIAVSPQKLRRRLHEAGYRWKRPRYVYAERAAHLPQRKRGDYPASEGGLARGDRLLCLDWTLWRLFPPLRATWALTGTQALVPITGRNAKRVLFGTIDLRSARRVVLVRTRAGQADAQAFLRALRRWYRRAGCQWALNLP